MRHNFKIERDMAKAKDPKNRTKGKEPVRLRSKLIKGGSESLYLDTYHKGQRKVEYLKLYIVPERTPADKEQNRATREIALNIKSKRIIELQASDYNVNVSGGLMRKTKLTAFVEQIIREKNERGAYVSTALAGLHRRVTDFAPNATLKDIDAAFVAKFASYLKTAANPKGGTLCPNTQCRYMESFKFALAKAVSSNLLKSNPFDNVDKSDLPKSRQIEIPYLTIEELKTIRETPCDFGDVKPAYLFGCFTGLRFSDIRALTWADVRKSADGTLTVVLRQKKTSEMIYLPLAKPAVELLAERERLSDADRVFKLQDNKEVNVKLKAFATAAGISGKKVTFHTSRHTCATALLSLGVSIETVSKILGHSRISTTQIYAKVMAEQVKQGVDKFNEVF